MAPAKEREWGGVDGAQRICISLHFLFRIEVFQGFAKSPAQGSPRSAGVGSGALAAWGPSSSGAASSSSADFQPYFPGRPWPDGSAGRTAWRGSLRYRAEWPWRPCGSGRAGRGRRAAARPPARLPGRPPRRPAARQARAGRAAGAHAPCCRRSAADAAPRRRSGARPQPSTPPAARSLIGPALAQPRENPLSSRFFAERRQPPLFWSRFRFHACLAFRRARAACER